jgi:uncharacterized repeat protein (TIGR01451 family)
MTGARRLGRLCPLAMLLAAVAVSGCAGIQSGPPVYQPSVPGFRPDDDVAVLLAPRDATVPVGSQVVLVAGVRAGDGFLRGSRRLEWSIGPGSVGSFANVGDAGLVDWMMGDLTLPRIQAPNAALGLTLRRREHLILPGGAPPVDVQPGQGWISVVSFVPGNTAVTVFAPDVVVPGGRTQTTILHWVSGLVPAPAPVISSVPGTPAPPATSTPATGGRPQLTVKKTGPATAALGQTLAYHIVVTNPGDAPAKDVVASDDIPDGVSYVSSTPPAEVGGKRLQWRLGDIAPRQQQTIDLTFRAEQQGSTTNCVEVAASGGLRANDCTTTIIGPAAAPAQVDVQISSPDPVKVNDQATFEIVITNRGSTPTVPLLIKDRFGDGLEHSQAKNSIERDLGSLTAGESRRITVTFRATQPGRRCHTVEVSGNDGTHATAEGCVMVEAGKPVLSIKKTGPAKVKAGEVAEFLIEVANNGTEEAKNLKVTDHYDPSMTLAAATQTDQPEEKNARSWIIPSLPARKRIQLQVQCTCNTPGPKVCNRVELVAPDGTRVEDQACVEVLAAAGGTTAVGGSGLTLELDSLTEPVYVGKEFRYEVRVANPGPAAQQQVAVTVELPLGIIATPFGTTGPAGAKWSVEGSKIIFTPVPAINAGDRLVYHLRLKAQQIGRFRVHADLTSQGHPEPVSVDKTTSVAAQQ